MQKVRAELGREYALMIGGERVTTGNFLNSVNPSKPAELVGAHHKANADLARHAVEDAHAYFAEWGATDAKQRVEMLLKAAIYCVSGSWSSTRGLCSKPERPGRRPRPRHCRSDRFLRILRAADAALCIPRCPLCNCRARRMRSCTCRWAWASSSRHGIFRSRSWRHDSGGAGHRQHGRHEAFQRDPDDRA